MMANKFILPIVLGMLMLSSNTSKPVPETGKVKFYVDSATNSDDPEKRMAYGLNIVPPWANGGSIFVNLPEHFEYMPGTKGIARHHDKRTNVWQISADSSEAHYAVESITEPGVFFSVKATSIGERARFEISITNHSEKKLNSLRPMFCYQYNLLKGFPIRLTDNFAHSFIVVNGKLVSVADLAVKDSNAIARMAQVKDCKDEHNWWAEEMGGFIEQRMDVAYTILTSANDDRKVILRWTPGKNLLTNAYIPCIHADPCMGNLEPGDSRTANGELIFTRVPLEQVINKFPIK